MFKDGSNPFASPEASEATPLERGGDSVSDSSLTLQDEIGFVGLGRMGTAMAANLAIAGHRVIAYVRRSEQMGRLMALGLKPTTDATGLFDCKVVISMLPDDDAVRDVVFGREDLGSRGLASGLRPGAIRRNGVPGGKPRLGATRPLCAELVRSPTRAMPAPSRFLGFSTTMARACSRTSLPRRHGFARPPTRTMPTPSRTSE